jgi:hypothetical protein
MSTPITGVAATLARIAELQAVVRTLSDRPTTATASDRSGFTSALDRARGTTAVGTSGSGREGWSTDLLSALGLPVTSENLRALEAWVEAEGTDAAFNPLATTQAMPGATNFNSVGVKSYASYQDGLAATVRTLTNGRYEGILAALARGTSAVDVAHAVAASPWGTGQGVLRVLGAG